MARVATTPARTHTEGSFSVAAWLAIFVVAAAGVLVVGTMDVEAQSYLVMAAVVAFLGTLLIPRATRKEPTVSKQMLWVAVVVFLLGSLLRYVVIQTVYGGASDARGYFGAGLVLSEQFRNLDFSLLVPPFSDTQAINYFSGFLYMLLPPAQLAGFVTTAAMALIGVWHFYRAFRTAYPDGNHRLYAILIFFVPSFWYWTTSLGKDGPVIMGMGLATYGFALLFQRLSGRALLFIVAGIVPVAIVRAPMAAALGLAGVGAFALRPIRARSVNVQALSYIVFLPLLIAGAVILMSAARQQTNVEGFDVQAALQTRVEALEDEANFTPPNAFTPAGLPMALVTANFRPFPFEAGGFFPMLQSLEGVALATLFLFKLREVGRGLAQWRRNAMTILVVAAVVIISIELSALSNFGLLARQRTQVLPYLLMLPCMVRLPRRPRTAAT